MTTLTPMLPNGDVGTATNSWTRSAGAWSITGTSGYVNVDDAITASAADGDTGIGLALAGNTTASQVYELTASPSDLASMTTLAAHYSTALVGTYSDDTADLRIAVMAADGTTVLAAATSTPNLSTGAGMQQLEAFNGSWQSWGGAAGPAYNKSQSFAYVDTTATKAQWDGARAHVRMQDIRNMGSDSAAVILVDFELTGTYASVARPTIRQDRFPARAGAKINNHYW